MPAPPPSTRFLRAVAAERDQLDRHRARMAEEADELRRALARIERGLAEIDERRALLDRVAGIGAESPRGAAARGEGTRAGGAVVRRGEGAQARGEAGAGEDARGGPGSAGAGAGSRGDAAGEPGAGEGVGGDAGGEPGSAGAGSRGDAAPAGGGDPSHDDPGRADRLLRGPEIREAAVRALLERDAGDALHYRDWFALLAGTGHEIAGKDPLAVFLTQLSRSPAVRRGSGAGVYELDRHAGARLRATLERLQRELRELTISSGTDLSAIRARREQLNAEIGRVERALEEIGRVLGPAPPLAAAG